MINFVFYFCEFRLIFLWNICGSESEDHFTNDKLVLLTVLETGSLTLNEFQLDFFLQ